MRVVLENSKQKWVSDIIGDDYKTWRDEFVVLDCGTGTGKTYFCTNILGDYAKKEEKRILYLCNRSKLRKDVERFVWRLNLEETIDVMSYQILQEQLMAGVRMMKYDYIIADECHYFTSDALFNEYTDVSYKYITHQKDTVILFISATAKKFFQRLLKRKSVKENRIYKTERDYSYVDGVYYYRADELVSIIDEILKSETDSKIVVFCNNTNRIFEMQQVYREAAHYYCSKYTRNRELKQLCGWNEAEDPDYIKYYSEDLITFEKRILFTTSALDNGVDLKDKNIKHIFTELIDVDIMVQSLGRKRSISEDDKCIFYIREYQTKGIQGILNQVERQLKPIDLYTKDYKSFYGKYGDGKMRNLLKQNHIIYMKFGEERKSGRIKINRCRYYKYIQDRDMYRNMKALGHIGYLEQMLDKQLVDKSEHIVINKKQVDTFLEYLKSIEGKKLFEEQKNLIRREFQTTIAAKLQGNCIGIHTLNGQLDDIYGERYPARFYNKDRNGKDYIEKRRVLEDGTRNPNRDKAFWILENRRA